MKIGDIVQHKQQHWVVRNLDMLRTRLATLITATGQMEEIPYNADVKGDVIVLANPSAEWPFVMLKERPTLGQVQRVVRFVGPVQHPVEQELRLYLDWVLSDPTRSGGPLFFSPSLNLQNGDTLVALYDKGRVRILIPPTFYTMKKRVALAAPPVKDVKTSYTHLLGEDFEG